MQLNAVNQIQKLYGQIGKNCHYKQISLPQFQLLYISLAFYVVRVNNKNKRKLRDNV